MYNSDRHRKLTKTKGKASNREQESLSFDFRMVRKFNPNIRLYVADSSICP